MSLEQAFAANQFWNHNDDESHFFLLLVQHQRAGTPALRAWFKHQIDEQKKQQLEIKKHVASDHSISELDRSIYYSSWKYAAVHVLLSIPKFTDRESICQALGISMEEVNKVLQFLIRVGLARQEGTGFELVPGNIHLESDSPFIERLHLNWRTKSLESVERQHPEDLHYSLVFTISEKDTLKVRQALVDAIKQVNEIFVPSKEETARVLTVDFFSLLNS